MNSKPKNTGVDAEKLFEKEMEEAHGKGAFIYRIPDHKEISRGGKVKGVSVRKTPADYLVSVDGNTFYCEIKSTENTERFGFNMFTEGELNAMKRQQAAGGVYVVMVYRIQTKSWYMMFGSDVLTLMDKGMKSVRWENWDSIDLKLSKGLKNV